MSYKNKVHFLKYRKFFLLFPLYLSQGLPFGFQATALPAYLRTEGISLTLIGFTGLLASPWLFKALWAPLLDRYWCKKTGRRRTWLIPLQIMLILSITAASFASSAGLPFLLTAVFIMNLTAATQDIAVDGLAVDILEEDELGHGNAVQVIGYKAGMLISGGLLVWLSSCLSWQIMFAVMALLASVPLIPVFLYKEKEVSANTERLELKDIIKTLKISVHNPSFRILVLFITTYKFGEVMIDTMFKPFLIDSGFTVSDIGLWVGTWGMAASLAGSFAGGFLASQRSLKSALITAVSLRLIPLVCETMLTVITPLPEMVAAVTILEHFFGGVLTTVLFAFMMYNVDRRIGATHYTILASLEVAGKAPGTWLSGIAADAYGYTALFAAGTIFSAAVIFILPFYRDNRERE